MTELRITLTTDGSSDQALLPILKWLLRELGVSLPINEKWADTRWLRQRPRTLAERVRTAVELEPCDILFVHRDAEGQPAESRRNEIAGAVRNALLAEAPPAVCVVPVRMTEAWFLIDESAIRFAAGNPRGSAPLGLPPPRRLEAIPDPKELLYNALRAASDHRPGRRRSFRPERCVHSITPRVASFEPLRELTAFRQLEADLTQLLPAVLI